jgi:hypothetical protein
MAVAADYADAMLVARRWKNLLFLVLFLILLIQIGVFVWIRFETPAPVGAATQPTMLAGRDVAAALTWVINTTDFLAIVAVVVLAVVLLLIVGIMLVGRLIGVERTTRAFIGCVLLGVLLFPWQSLWDYPVAGTMQTEPSPQENVQVGPPVGLPGVLYTWPELQHKAHFASAPWTAAWLGWARFVGWPVVAIILLFRLQVHSSRGLKFALGEAEVEVEPTRPASPTA